MTVWKVLSARMRDRSKESGRPIEIILNFQRDGEVYVVLKTKLYLANTTFMYFYLRMLEALETGELGEWALLTFFVNLSSKLFHWY